MFFVQQILPLVLMKVGLPGCIQHLMPLGEAGRFGVFLLVRAWSSEKQEIQMGRMSINLKIKKMTEACFHELPQTGRAHLATF